MELIIKCLTTTIEGVVTGHISLKRLKVIFNKQDAVINLFDVLLEKNLLVQKIIPESGKSNSPSQILRKIIEWRKREVDVFKEKLQDTKQVCAVIEKIGPGMYIHFLAGNVVSDK